MSAVYAVVGMHKSGTTLAAQLLDASGVPMVEEADGRGYDAGNKCERLATNLMNKRLLVCASKTSLQVLEAYQTGRDHDTLLQAARQVLSRSCPVDAEHWGFKDPRTCLTHAVWAELIPDLRVVCIYRPAASVRQHYVKRTSRIRANGLRALRAWAVYNLAMIKIYSATPPAHRIILNYDVLLEDSTELDRLGSFLGKPINDVRRPELNRRGHKKTLPERLDAKLVKLIWGHDVDAVEARLNRLFEEERDR